MAMSETAETAGFEQHLQEQNDILRRFMEAEFAKQAVLLHEIGSQLGRLGHLPAHGEEEEVQAEAVPVEQPIVHFQEVQAELEPSPSWHPKPDHSKAVPNAGLQGDEDSPSHAEVLSNGCPSDLPADVHEHERQVSTATGPHSFPSETSEKNGGPRSRPSESYGLGSVGVQLKSMMKNRETVKGQKMDEHQRRALKASGSFMSDRTEVSLLSPSVQRLRKVVTSQIFGHCVMGLILANMIILGVEVDTVRLLPPTEEPDYFFIINNVIVACFVLEIILKVLAFGCYSFFCGRERGWNIFDCIVVCLSLVESVSDIVSRSVASSNSGGGAAMDSSNLRVVRFTRVIRALRGVRVVRLLRFISSLRAILFSISSCMGSLVWTLVLLMIMFYCFGVIIAQLVSDHCRYLTHVDVSSVECPENLLMYWSGVVESMMTLFHSISGGLSWVEAFTPLKEFSTVAAAFMYLYIVITVFAVLNVVTGVFCNTAIENAKADKDIAVMKQMQKHRSQVDALRAVFHDIDVNQSKLVNLKELKTAMEESKLSSFMESMDISTKDIWTLFMLIDADESGEISIDEFVQGCMQLQGPAKSIQMARLRHDSNLMRRDIRILVDEVDLLRKALVPPAAKSPKN